MIYTVTVSREREHWLASVPELPGAHTFAGNLPALRKEVEEVIRLVADLPDSEAVSLQLEFDESVAESAREALGLRNHRKELEDELARLSGETKATVSRLASEGYSVRDIGDIIGLTPGRVSQISKELV